VTYGLLEYFGENQEEDGAEKVDGGNGNVETVGLLIHVWAQDAHTDEEASLDQDESDGLDSAVLLGKPNEHGFNKSVGQDGNDEVVHGSLELHIQETPLVESGGIRVQDVGGVLVHGNGPLGNAHHFGRSPSQDADHGDQGKDGQDHLAGGVALGKLPEAEDHHLREADENDAEENALEHSLPAVAEIGELVVPHLAGLDQALADVFEGNDAKDDQQDKDDEEGVAGKEDVGGLDAGLEGNALDAIENDALVGVHLSVGRILVTAGHDGANTRMLMSRARLVMGSSPMERFIFCTWMETDDSVDRYCVGWPPVARWYQVANF